MLGCKVTAPTAFGAACTARRAPKVQPATMPNVNFSIFGLETYTESLKAYFEKKRGGTEGIPQSDQRKTAVYDSQHLTIQN